MMADDFGEIHPGELKFIFEPKKHMSCTMNLISKSDQYIAFKVKTTRPKLYCVRPITIGILKPNSTCEIEVKRQACNILPETDTFAKEKFLIQRAIVSKDTTLEEVRSLFRSKDRHDDINEKKLMVVVDVIPKVEEMKSKSEECDLRVEEGINIMQMKSKIKELNLQLTEAEDMILKLKEEKSDCGCKGKKRRHRLFIKCFNVKLFDV